MGSHSQEGLLDKIVQHWLPILALTPQARTEWLPSLLSRAPITSNWKQIHILAPVFWASTNIERLGSILGFPTLATFLEMPWPLAANRRPIPADQTLAGAKRSHLQTASEMKPCLGTQETSQLYHAVVDPPRHWLFRLIMWTLEPWLSGYKIPARWTSTQFIPVSGDVLPSGWTIPGWCRSTACQRTCRLNFLDDLSGSCGLAFTITWSTWSSVLMCIQRIPKVTPEKIGQHISDDIWWYIMIYALRMIFNMSS